MEILHGGKRGHARPRRYWHHSRSVLAYQWASSHSVDIYRASTKAPLCRLKPNSEIGSEVSQLEAPLSLARLSVLVVAVVRRCLISSAARVDCSLRCCLMANLADNWASMHPKEYSAGWTLPVAWKWSGKQRTVNHTALLGCIGRIL